MVKEEGNGGMVFCPQRLSVFEGFCGEGFFPMRVLNGGLLSLHLLVINRYHVKKVK